MIETKHILRLALVLAATGAACLLVAVLRRHHVEDAFGSIEGAYFNRSVGEPAYAAVFSGNILDPFRPLNAYLWLGAGVGLGIASTVLVVVAHRNAFFAPAGWNSARGNPSGAP